MSVRREPWLGGPGTVLPRPVESLLGWTLALSCLSVSGYHYIVETFAKPFSVQFFNSLRRKSISGDETSHQTTTFQFPCWLPLMSYSRAELDRASPTERFEQLACLLNALSLTRSENGRAGAEVQTSSNEMRDSVSALSDDELVRLIRSNEILRRLASLAMRPQLTTNPCHSKPLGQQLILIWPRLLVLPPLSETIHGAFLISLIVPCYHETVEDISQKLNFAVTNSEHPERIQVIIVLAGIRSSSTDKKALLTTADFDRWGEVKVVELLEESGRGPCLNFGAEQADGAIYAFCHSDTRLPHHWDTKLTQILDPDKSITGARPNSCAFGFGIDTSKEGLKGGSCPPGIGAVETTANLRCRLWSLPYGDQCLSLRADDFHYLGGFPHQCFMEDYELIALLRKRARLLPRFRKATANVDRAMSEIKDEVLKIVPGPPALCSPRRWQCFGVIYVTHTNSKLVCLYKGGMTPDEIYRLYYGETLAVIAPKSPWEIELDNLILSN